MNRLWVQLSVMFGSLILLGTVINFAATRLLVDRSYRPALTEASLFADDGLIPILRDFYSTNQSWDGVERLMMGAQSMSWNGPGGASSLRLLDADGEVVYPSYVSAPSSDRDRPPAAYQAQLYPIRTDGETVGYVQVRQLRAPPRPDDSSSVIVDEFSRWLLLVVGMGALVSILLSIWFSRNLTAPLEQLADAATTIGSGDLTKRVDASGSEEIQEVAHAFNEMAADLQTAETVRRNLVADVAHELRTPLSVIQGSLSALLDDVYPLEKSEIARIYDQSRLLARLVDDLRLIAQAEAGQLPLNLQAVDMGKLAEDTVATFAAAAHSQQTELHVDVADDLPVISGDSARLSQVLHNLLANALRHTPAGGKVDVNLTAEPESVVVTVEDTGQGIAPEHLPHLFDRFYRTDSARARDSGGSGLGLAITRTLVEAHGGTIQASSPGPEQGSTFTLRLPIHATPLPENLSY